MWLTGGGGSWLGLLYLPLIPPGAVGPAVGGEEATSMHPEEWPDHGSIGLGQGQFLEGGSSHEVKSTFAMLGRELINPGFYLEKEHEPMGGILVAVFAHQTGQVQVCGADLDSHLFSGFTACALVRGFAVISFQLATARTIEATVWFLGPFQQQYISRLVEAVEPGGNFIGEWHEPVGI
jgi:hypothetical protein